MPGRLLLVMNIKKNKYDFYILHNICVPLSLYYELIKLFRTICFERLFVFCVIYYVRIWIK